LPNAGYRTLAHTFNLHNSHLVEQHGREVLVSKSFVAQLLRQYRLDMQAKPRPSGARTEPIQTTWGMDLTGLPLASGGTAPVFGLIDHGSRALLALTPVVPYNSLVLLGQLLIAMGRHGKPRAVRSDNDAVFKTPVFRIALALLGVHQQFTALGSPWQNGRIERFWRTLKTELQTNTVNTRFQGQPVQTRMKLASVFTMHVLLDAFKSSYNYDRPHQSLRGQTPAMVWASQVPKARAKLRAKPSKSKPPT
jgi:putative transposase